MILVYLDLWPFADKAIIISDLSSVYDKSKKNYLQIKTQFYFDYSDYSIGKYNTFCKIY